MAQLINRIYTMSNKRTGEVVQVEGMNMTKWDACEQAGLGFYDYKVVNVEDVYETLTVTTGLTNAQLIEILMQRDPNARAEFFVDFSLWDRSSHYTEIDSEDGVSYVAEHDRIVINAGEFEC